MHYPTVAIQTIVAIEDGNGTSATGIVANVNAAVYDESDNFVANIAVAEIGGTGMYQGSFTPDAVGTWKVLWTCTSPLARMLADTNETQGKLPTNNIMGSSDKADHDDEINDILTDTNEIQTKLPDNFIMGSSVSTDKDDEIDDILVDTNEIQGKLPNNNIMGSSDKDDHDIDSRIDLGEQERLRPTLWGRGRFMANSGLLQTSWAMTRSRSSS